MSKILEAVLLTVDQPTINNNIYPKDEVQKALSKVKTPLFGCFGDVYGQDLERVSHEITDIKFDGDRLIGTVRTLNTPYGKILRDLIEGGNTPSIGISCSGNIESDGKIRTITNIRQISFNYAGDTNETES